MTIEERAEKYIDKNFTRIAEEMAICDGMKTIYIESATEQKAIDDEQLPLIKETYYNAGYETAKNKMIDKACEWLEHNADKYAVDAHWVSSRMFDAFKKAMEE